MAGNRSIFTKENNYAIDSFPTLSSLPPDKVNEANELQTLMMTINKTDQQNTRMNQLLVELADYYIDPNTWDHMQDCIFNLESNYLNIYHEFTSYIDIAEANINTYINSKETDMTNFVNQKETDVVNFVNTQETAMTSMKDSYISIVNQKESEMEDLDSRTERYWQKWNATSVGQTDYNIFDTSGYNTALPTSATIDIDVQNIDVIINGIRQVPYEDYDKKQDSNGLYTIITLKGNASSLVNVGTEVFAMYYKNVGKLYFKHAVTHQAGGRDQITVSEPMFDTNLTNKINNQINTSTTVSTNAFKGQVWFAPI